MIDYREVLSSFAVLIMKYCKLCESGQSHKQALDAVSANGLPEGTNEALAIATEAIDKLRQRTPPTDLPNHW